LPQWISRSVSARGVRWQDAPDAVHDVIWRLMANVDRIREPERFGIYAYRTMQHVARMYRPRKDVEPFIEDMAASRSENLDRHLDLEGALGELSPRLAKALTLVY